MSYQQTRILYLQSQTYRYHAEYSRVCIWERCIFERSDYGGYESRSLAFFSRIDSPDTAHSADDHPGLSQRRLSNIVGAISVAILNITWVVDVQSSLNQGQPKTNRKGSYGKLTTWRRPIDPLRCLFGLRNG